jgi:hypothetical protein
MPVNEGETTMEKSTRHLDNGGRIGRENPRWLRFRLAEINAALMVLERDGVAHDEVADPLIRRMRAALDEAMLILAEITESLRDGVVSKL